MQDVDSYPLFLSYMPQCKADPSSRHEHRGKYGKTVRGGFRAPTTIGFNAVSFDYISNVTYSHPKLPVNLCPSQKNNWTKSLRWRVTTDSESSRIFNSFKSEWRIRANPDYPISACIVDYNIEMGFSNSLYSAVTRQFFNFLVDNIND